MVKIKAAKEKEVKSPLTWGRFKRQSAKYWQLYVLLLVPLGLLLLFSYWPMYGLQLAFKDFYPRRGIWGSPWVGLTNFKNFLSSFQFAKVMRNTLTISTTTLIIGFPMPILLALGLNELASKKYKKVVQSATFFPYFVSIIVLIGLMWQLLDVRIGPINALLRAIGGESAVTNFRASPNWVVPLYVITSIWQNTGYSAVVYLAALSGISIELQEAAIIDGASKVQKIWHINLPGIKNTAVVLFILSLSNIVGVGFEKVFAMQNPTNRAMADVLSTYIYSMGVTSGDFAYATAVGLFNSLITFALVFTSNAISRKVNETSLW